MAKRPSENRPVGTAVCFVCDGWGTRERRICGRCSGRGYLGTAKSEGSQVLEPKALANHELDAGPHAVDTTSSADTRPYGPVSTVVNSVFSGRLTSLPTVSSEPWYMTTAPHPRTCISCNGIKGRKRCPRCRDEGVDPWAMDLEIEHEARATFEQGWRPARDEPTAVFMLGKPWKKETVSLDVWMTMHQLCVEEKLLESRKHSVGRP